MFRIQRLKGIIDEDKNSAHFSMKDSNLELSGRLSVFFEIISSSRVSARWGGAQASERLSLASRQVPEAVEQLQQPLQVVRTDQERSRGKPSLKLALKVSPRKAKAKWKED